MKRLLKVLLWAGVSLAGAGALGAIALERDEPVNATWMIVAAACCFLLGYRFYSAFIAARVMALDETRATPAERLSDGRDYVPTNRWVLMGHHFASIAGPGPLIGPTLAAQFGYLPGTLWLIVGAVLGGCVQDFVILFFSIRRNGKSLGQIARDEVSPLNGSVALVAVMAIMIILLAAIALVVVNALRVSPWATFTMAASMPIAMLVGRFWMIIPAMAIAGALAAKKTVPPSAGTFPTTGALFVGLVVGVIVIVGALTFFPALALGPIVEHFAMVGGTPFSAN